MTIKKKTCKKCNNSLELNEENFYRRRRGSKSWDCYCKSCKKKIASINNKKESYKLKVKERYKKASPEQLERVQRSRKRSREKRLKCGKVRMFKNLYCGFLERSYGSKHPKTCQEYVGLSKKDFVAHIESLFLPGMSWDNYGNKYVAVQDSWQMDHIVPLVSFDLTKEEEVCKAWHYTNLRPLWATENLRKQR